MARLVYRAFHALPPLNRKSDGLPTNAVLGFCNMLWKLLVDASAGVKPTHLAVVFDKSEHNVPQRDVRPVQGAPARGAG